MPVTRQSLSHPTYLVRHGETESNRLKRYAGRGGEPLTERGRTQATRIADELSAAGATQVLTSRIARAVETAEIIGRRLGLRVRGEPRLDEIAMGPWEGKLESEIERDWADEWRLWHMRPHELRLPGRETLDEVAARVMSLIHETARQGPSILVTHVAPIRVAALTVLGAPLREYKRLHVDNGSCIRVDVDEGEVVRLPEGRCIRIEPGRRSDEFAVA